MTSEQIEELYTFTLTEKTNDAYVWRLEGVWPIYIPTAADLPIQPPVVIDHQHAALRWERVARRWAAKGRDPAAHRVTVEGDIAFDPRCATGRGFTGRQP